MSPESTAGAQRERWTGEQVGWPGAAKVRLSGSVMEKEAPAVALRQWLFLLQRRGPIKVLYRRERSQVCLKLGGEQWVVMETGRCSRRSRGPWHGREGTASKG